MGDIIKISIEIIVHYNEPIRSKLSSETLTGVEAYWTDLAATYPNNKT